MVTGILDDSTDSTTGDMLGSPPSGIIQTSDDGFRFSPLQADMMSTLNRASPGTFPDELVRKAWADVDATPSAWPSLKARYSLPDNHIMNLAYQMNRHTRDGLSGADGATQLQTTPVAGPQQQNDSSPPSQGPSTVDNLVQGIQDSPAGQFIKGFTEMPKDKSNPYDGMSDPERYGRNMGEYVPLWDSARDYGQKTWDILKKRWNGEEPTKEELDAQSKATDKMIIEGFTNIGVGKVAKIAPKAFQAAAGAVKKVF